MDGLFFKHDSYIFSLSFITSARKGFLTFRFYQLMPETSNNIWNLTIFGQDLVMESIAVQILYQSSDRGFIIQAALHAWYHLPLHFSLSLLISTLPTIANSIISYVYFLQLPLLLPILCLLHKEDCNSSWVFISLTAAAGTRCMTVLSSSPNLFFSRAFFGAPVNLSLGTCLIFF